MSLFKCLMIVTALCMSFAGAEFREGIILLSIKNPQGSGTVELKISEKATRSVLKMQQMKMQVNMDFLIKHNNPNTVYQINENNKTYSIIDLKKIPQQIPESTGKESFTVTKMGEETLLGYKTIRVAVESKNKERTEMWVSKDFKVYEIMKKLQSAGGQASSQLLMYKVLEKKGFGGFPLRTISFANGQKTSMEAVKIEKKKFPSSLFEIPDGFKRSESASPIIDNLTSPENMQTLQKMMKENLTPEKIEALKKMMEEAGKQQGR